MSTPIETAAEALYAKPLHSPAKREAAAAAVFASLAQHRDDIARDTCPGNHAALDTEHVPHADMGCQWSEQHTDAVLAYLGSTS